MPNKPKTGKLAKRAVHHHMVSQPCDDQLPEGFTDVSDNAKRIDVVLADKRVRISPELLYDVLDLPRGATEDPYMRLEHLLFKVAIYLLEHPSSDNFSVTTRMELGSYPKEHETYDVEVVKTSATDKRGPAVLTLTPKTDSPRTREIILDPSKLRYTPPAYMELGRRFEPY